jgi:2-hydroxy-6-oxonona-2,4-dienedioate hydrolase
MGSPPTRTVFLVVALCAIVAAVATVTQFYRADIQPALDRVSRGSLIAQTTCGPLEYAVAGDGPSVLIVHGAGGGFDQGLEFGTSALSRPILCR